MKKAPKEIYLNINDDYEMPPCDEIAWDEVTWSANRPATKQAILYISYDALSKWDDEMKAVDARNQKLESIVQENHDKLCALAAALKHLVEVIEAHEIESLACDRDGNEYCDCLRNAATEAKRLLPNSDVRCHSDSGTNT